MTLRLKIHLIVGALMLAFMAAMFGLQLQSMRASVNEEIAAAHRVALQMLNRITWAYAAQGTPALRHYLQGLGRVRAHDILLFDAAGNELYRSPPSPYKQGRDAPSWFQALVAPQTLAQSIGFPDGRLELRADASRSVLDAWDELTRLAGIALAALLLANALVYWLVGRTVRPFGRIVQALEGLQAGGFDQPMPPLPPLPGREAHAIGEAYNRMLEQLRHHLETERRADRAEAQLADSRELTRWIDQHLEQERHFIARELHDELGQSVTGMRSIALSIAQRAGDPETERAARLIADEASRLYDAMHGMIPRLTPLELAPLGLPDALNDLVSGLRQRHPGWQLGLQLNDRHTPLAAPTALVAYRVAQEAVNNALKHSGGSHITVSLGRNDPHHMRLTIDDDGCGLPPPEQRPARFGLTSLRERVLALGGWFEANSRPEGGTRIQATLPCFAEEEAA
jgi:two-component system sensor histidine kinase UhpB